MNFLTLGEANIWQSAPRAKEWEIYNRTIFGNITKKAFLHQSKQVERKADFKQSNMER
jgi:hypothetical protein